MGTYSRRCINSQKSVKKSIIKTIEGIIGVLFLVLLLIATVITIPLLMLVNYVIMLGIYLYDKFDRYDKNR